MLEKPRPDLDLDVAPRDGVISRQWIELASVEFVPSQVPVVSYHAEALWAVGYDFDQVRTEFVIASSRRCRGRPTQPGDEGDRGGNAPVTMADG